MKKKIAIIAALIAALVIGAFAFTACGGEEEEPEPPRYEYYSMVYDAELEGLVLSVAHSALLAEGAISVPSSSYYYADEEGGETVRHDEPVDIVALADGAFEGVSRAHTVSLPSTVKGVGYAYVLGQNRGRRVFRLRRADGRQRRQHKRDRQQGVLRMFPAFVNDGDLRNDRGGRCVCVLRHRPHGIKTVKNQITQVTGHLG